MKREIIKIKVKTYSELSTAKIGDVIQFNSLPPVRVVTLGDCRNCCFCEECNDFFKPCNYVILDFEENDAGLMFEKLKND
jgi:hypothetical protein